MAIKDPKPEIFSVDTTIGITAGMVTKMLSTTEVQFEFMVKKYTPEKDFLMVFNSLKK